MRWHNLVVIALIIATNMAWAAQNNSSDQLGAPKINYSGLRPDVDGFTFPNYGDNPKTVDLTPAEMQRMFGDRVCASKSDGACVLTFPAKRWMDEANSAMKYGHCEGIAVLSDLMYYDQIEPNRFGSDRAIELSLQNETLQREIGYWWVTQVTNPGGSNKISLSPNAVLDTLMTTFGEGKKANEWWILGIYLPDGSGGHSITPIAVEDMGNGTSRIFVYDNNWPEENRSIEVDRNANTWKYQASINPNEPSSLYSGNASTQSLEIVSVSSRMGLQDCNFCSEGDNSTNNSSSKEGRNSLKHMTIWQDGNANVLVSDDLGRRVGFLESGESINEIPESEIRNLKFGLVTLHSPVIFVPMPSANASYLNVTVSSSLKNNDANPVRTTIIAPGLALSSLIPNLGQGQKQDIDFTRAGEGFLFSFRANQLLSPILSLDTDFRQLTLNGLNIEPTGNIRIGMNPLQETFSMSTIGINDPGTLKIQLTSIDRKSGESSFFQSVDLLLRPNDGLSMNLGNSTNNTSKPSISIAHKNGVMQEIQLAAASGAGFPSSANFIKPNLPLTANTRQPLSPVSGDMTDIDLPSNNNMPASMPSISMPSLPAS